MTQRGSPTQQRIVTEKEAKEQIKGGAEFSATSATGGAQKQAYWTPDGRRLVLVPQIRQFVKKNDKNEVIASGTRDANLDKGYLTHSPSESERKVFCRWCDTWHDTQVQVDACKVVYDKLQAHREAIAKQELANEVVEKDREIDSLTNRVAQLEKLIKEKLGG